MRYKSKGYVFDEEVTAWLDRLKAAHGSYNKGLRRVAFAAGKSEQQIAQLGNVTRESDLAKQSDYHVEYDEGQR